VNEIRDKLRTLKEMLKFRPHVLHGAEQERPVYEIPEFAHQVAAKNCLKIMRVLH
jgi:hypothetical protein